jgi:hypothetical protein
VLRGFGRCLLEGPAWFKQVKTRLASDTLSVNPQSPVAGPAHGPTDRPAQRAPEQSERFRSDLRIPKYAFGHP